MSFVWVHESPALWDAGKQAIVGGAPAGVFKMPKAAPGDLLPGEWWRAEKDGLVVGYGWLDTNWGGDAEVLLAVAPSARGTGAGTFILDQLEREAAAAGLNYLYNVVQPTHPEGVAVKRWLEKRRFKASDEGRLIRRVLARPS